MHIVLGGRTIYHFAPHRECEGEVETRAMKHAPPVRGAGLMRDDGVYLGEITAMEPGKLERFILFYDVEEPQATSDVKLEPEPDPDTWAEVDFELLNSLLKEHLPAKAYNSVIVSNVDVVTASDERLLSLSGVGPKCLETIREVVGQAALDEE